MQLAKIRHVEGHSEWGIIHDAKIFYPAPYGNDGSSLIGEILNSNSPMRLAAQMVGKAARSEPFGSQTLLAPVHRQEIWAAGVTYKRSKIAREEESAGAAQFYDKVYTADRPELFMKATAWRAVGPNQLVRIRGDGKWNVPEPELALVLSPSMKIVGFTIGNDMSSRDIEGENPLYLPQAKIYDGSCALGPVITLAEAFPPRENVRINLDIIRNGEMVFTGETTLTQMARSLESLVEWLGKETSFPDGAILMTGTGIVPPDTFTLASGDKINITITGIGTLSNTVA